MNKSDQQKSNQFQLLGRMRRAENGKGRKSNVSVPEALKLEKSSAPPRSNGLVKMLQQNMMIILQVLGGVAALYMSLSAYRNSSSAIQNLVNSNQETLKTALTGDMPYLFYCHRGGKDERIPMIFTELNKVKSSKMGFALVNCSQVLPSGKNLFERFKLRQEIKPTIFEAAPWTKTTQASKKDMKDVASLKKFVEQTMAPKAVEVLTDKDLMKHCGFSAAKKGAGAETNSRGETCFVLVKGSKFSKSHADLEERIIRSNPKVKIATIDAVKKRLSFEDPEALPGNTFALKIHALRNSTHHMSMVNPLTWDYLSTFMSQAISSPSYSYSGDVKSPIKLIKTGSSAFKSRSPPTGSGSGSPSSLPTIRKSKLPKAPEGTKATEKSGDKTSGESAEAQPPAPETLAEQFAREKRRRDEMERQSREHLFEDGDSEGEEEVEGGADEVGDDEEDESVIEL
jgi:hypothetical protein